MKIVSFNINGLRARPHQLKEVVDRHSPEVIGLQETKVDDPQFPLADLEALGYQVAFHGQKGHYGVALLTRQQPLWVRKGFPGDTDDAQRRMISAAVPCADGEPLIVFNGYFPQGESRDHPVKFPAKEKFYADLQAHLEADFSPEQRIAIIGDMNISDTDADIGIGPDNAKRWLRTGKCSFLPEERAWLQRLKDWGLIDSFRHLHPDTADRFSWFDYRSRGFEDDPKRGLRIDLILASKALAERCLESGIDYDIRSMEKPSDHAPIWTRFDL
ncbi:MAG: exodeoxyribonuclease III [Pseudomonadota bacterium]|nr:exodeoxyribonuclease III [Pseudomonadota bacterium]